jgi:hypothetical protein
MRVWGSQAVLDGLHAGWPAERIAATWQQALQRFAVVREKYLLYPI